MDASTGTARRLETVCIAGLIIVFACFTWRSLTMFFSDDDVMNMYNAWITPALFWTSSVSALPLLLVAPGWKCGGLVAIFSCGRAMTIPRTSLNSQVSSG